MMTITRCIAAALLSLATSGYCLADQADIDGSIEKYGMVIPAISCKTRTNNEATVRNLSHGVWNRDSMEPAILNCGFPTPYPWVFNLFPSNLSPNNSRVDGNIYFVFVRDNTVPDLEFEAASCWVTVSSEEAISLNPSIGIGANESVVLGTVQPNAANGLKSVQFISTIGVVYPYDYNFFSAYCQLPHHVRLQAIDIDPEEVNETNTY